MDEDDDDIGSYNLLQQEDYIRKHHYYKICHIHLCFCEFNLYKNGSYYLQQFICYYLK